MNFVRQNTNSPDHNTAVAQAFRDAEVRDRRLFEAAQEGILILDVDTGRINDANPFAVELLGVSPGEMSGKTLGELGAFKHVDQTRACWNGCNGTDMSAMKTCPWKRGMVASLPWSLSAIYVRLATSE